VRGARRRLLLAAGRAKERGALVRAQRSLVRRVGRPIGDDLAAELSAVARRGVPIHFVFATHEPGPALLEFGGGATARRLAARGALTIEEMADADHTFTRRAARERLLPVVEARLGAPAATVAVASAAAATGSADAPPPPPVIEVEHPPIDCALYETVTTVEALQELEEIAMLGYQNLAGHQEQLEHQKRLLEEVYDALGGHYHARYEVVHATNRTAVTRLKDEPTHEVLRIALEREDTARQNCNWAIKAARGERSAVMMQKAEVQRSARLRE
jgi:hypothetical protein